MFGLTQLQERLVMLGILGLVILGFAWHERHIGAQKCLQNVEKANVVEEKKEEKQHTADVLTVKKEGHDYEAATTAPVAPAPRIRLCPSLHSKAVQSPPATGPKADAEVPSGAGDTGPATVWDTTPLVKAGRDADAQIAGLQSYIRDVCRPQ